MAELKRYEGKTVDDALIAAVSDLGVTSDRVEYEVVERGSAGFLGLGSKPAVIMAKKKMTLTDIAEEFLKNVFEKMGMDVSMEIHFNEEEKVVEVNLVGTEMGNLIGKRGQTLDSLQYLTSLVINKENEEYIRVKIDTENYRERRKETLENLAKNISYKVKRTKRPVKLEPMNPYERRIIHAALQDDKYVYTKSEGEEPYRHVVVLLKKEKHYSGEKRYGNRGSYGNRYEGRRNNSYPNRYGSYVKKETSETQE